jgi:hypothetical protein
MSIQDYTLPNNFQFSYPIDQAWSILIRSHMFYSKCYPKPIIYCLKHQVHFKILEQKFMSLPFMYNMTKHKPLTLLDSSKYLFPHSKALAGRFSLSSNLTFLGFNLATKRPHSRSWKYKPVWILVHPGREARKQDNLILNH